MRTIDHPKTVVASSQEEFAKDQTVTMDWLLQKYPVQSRKEIVLDHNEGQNETLSKMFVTRLPLRRIVGADKLVQFIPGMGILCDPKPAERLRNELRFATGSGFLEVGILSGIRLNTMTLEQIGLWNRTRKDLKKTRPTQIAATEI